MIMKKHSFLFLAVALLLLAGCEREDRIVPDCTNLFFGLYSPSAQIREVGMVEAGGTTPLFTTQWLGRRLLNVSYPNPQSDFGETVVNQYHYDSHNRLADIDSNIFFTYNVEGLLSSVRIVLTDRTRTLSFQYDGGLQPVKVVDSTLYRLTTDINEWYSSSKAYLLEWRKGNLVKATPSGRDGVSYDFYYDDNHNPFCGFALSFVLSQERLLSYPSFFSMNNVTATASYNPDGSRHEYVSYDYEYYNTWPQVVNRHVGDDSTQTFTIKYR